MNLNTKSNSEAARFLKVSFSTYKKYAKKNSVKGLIPYLKNDKKNDDDKINFILLKDIGKTAMPNKSKISINDLKKMSDAISLY